MEIRTLSERDIPQLKKIWKDTFGDSEQFIDWYFSRRFFPEHSVCACADGRIVSVCHTMPAALYLRRKEISCALLNGVATLPEYRGRGLMKSLIAALYRLLPAKGICLMPNTPVDLRIYAPCGHYPNTDMVEIDEAIDRILPEGIRFSTLSAESETLFSLYTRIAPSYCGMLRRTRDNFLRKCEEYLLDSCKVILHEKGYAVYCDTREACICAEILAEDAETYRALADGLFSHAYPRKVQGKFPKEAFPQKTAHPRSVLGILHTEMFLKALAIPSPVVLQVTDAFYPENSGVFHLNGTPAAEPPQITLSIQALAQWLSGYCDLEETDAIIHAHSDLPKKQRCFTNDDY